MPLPFFIASLAKSVIGLLVQSEAVLLFAGDAMQHKAQLDAALQSDGTYSFVECFEPVKEIIKEADYAVVNLETPLGGKPYRGYPCFSAPDSYAEALIETGFDLLLTANNHALDRRDSGLLRTITVLDSLAIEHIGTYKDTVERANRTPLIVNIKGFKVGFLNYTYGTNGIEIQKDAVVNYINRETIANDIAASRRAGAEILCVAVHWGDEYQLVPNNEQRNLAKWLCQQGVDIIFGGHPHVIQPMELIDNPSTGRKTAIFYSLGNFISNMNTRDTRGGAMANVTLKRDSLGIAHVDDLNYRLIFTVPPTKSNNTFKLYPADDVVFDANIKKQSNDSAKYTSPLPHSINAKRDAFVKSANKIFSTHNKNVKPYNARN